jgi:hypothetical protein
MTRNTETISRYVGDMLSVVRHVHEAVDRQKTDQKVLEMPEAHELLQNISQTLDQHIAVLKRHQVSIDSSETGSSLRETVASTLGQAAGMIGMLRPDKVSLMLRDDYAALSMTAIAYIMLHTTALALQDETTAEIAVSNLGEITPLIVQINEVIPRVVGRELVDEADHIDLSIIPLAIQNTQAAWSNDHIHSSHNHDWEESSTGGEMSGF